MLLAIFKSFLSFDFFFLLQAALRRVIASARSEDVPKATIENAIKRATSVADQQEFTYEVLGPGNHVSSAVTFYN